MSLVNDMLRDLDKRNAPERAGALGSQQASESMIEPQKKLPMAAIYSTGLVIILLFVGAWYLLSASSPTTYVQMEQTHTPIEKTRTPIEQSLQPVLQERSAVNKASKEEARSESKPELKLKVREAFAERKNPSTTSIEHDLVSNNSSPLATQKRAVPKEALAQNKPSPVGGKSSDSIQAKVKALGGKKAQHLRDRTVSPVAPQSLSPVEAPLLAKPLNVTLSPSALDLKAASDSISLFELGQSEQAYTLMKDFIGSHRLSEKTKGVLANRLFADQRLLELQNLLQEEAQSLSSALRQVQARLLMHQGNVAQAISTLEYSSPSMEESPEYYALLASFYQRSGQSETAFDQYSQ